MDNNAAFHYQVVSDLHIERWHPDVPDWRKMITPIADTLILAGDVGHAENFKQYRAFLMSLALAFKQVILIPGNHEYYSKNKTFEEIRAKLRGLNIENVTVLDDSYIDLPGGIRIYGTTLWAAIPEEYHDVMTLPILTRKNSYGAGATWLNKMHYEAVYNLEEAMASARQANRRLMVVSHYAPTEKGSITAEHLKTNRHNYYANNLDRLIKLSNVHTWIFGHTHVNCAYINEQGTHVFSNQLLGAGYLPNIFYRIRYENLFGALQE